MPPGSSIWNPGPETGTGPRGHSAGRNPAGGHARDRRRGVGRRGPGRQGAGGCGCPERPSSCSGITLSDEGDQGERTRTAVLCGCMACWTWTVSRADRVDLGMQDRCRAWRGCALMVVMEVIERHREALRKKRDYCGSS